MNKKIKEKPKQLNVRELNRLDDIEIEEMSNDWETMSKQREPKQETLEEAYLNKLIDEANKEFSLDRKLAKEVAIKFAKWQIGKQDKNFFSCYDTLKRNIRRFK